MEKIQSCGTRCQLSAKYFPKKPAKPRVASFLSLPHPSSCLPEAYLHCFPAQISRPQFILNSQLINCEFKKDGGLHVICGCCSKELQLFQWHHSLIKFEVNFCFTCVCILRKLRCKLMESKNGEDKRPLLNFNSDVAPTQESK